MNDVLKDDSGFAISIELTVDATMARSLFIKGIVVNITGLLINDKTSEMMFEA